MVVQKILITGASGYVGQHLIASLASAGLGGGSEGRCELFCAYHSLPTFEDDLTKLLESSPLHASVVAVRPIAGVDFSRGGWVDGLIESCGEKIDAIVHLASLSSPGYCESHEAEAWRVNCPAGLLTLGAPIIYLSTVHVYEGTKSYYKEDDETVPVNVYGRTKLAFERLLLSGETREGRPLPLRGGNVPDVFREAGAEGGTEGLLPSAIPSAWPGSVVLRSSLILGPPTPLEHGCSKGPHPSFLQFVESRLRSFTPTDYFADQFRSVVGIDDVIAAIRHFLRHSLRGENSETTRVFNLGGSDRVSRYDVATEVAARLGLDPSSAEAVERPEGGVPSPPDISMTVDKITKELGVEKMKGLKEIVASTFPQSGHFRSKDDDQAFETRIHQSGSCEICST